MSRRSTRSASVRPARLVAVTPWPTYPPAQQPTYQPPPADVTPEGTFDDGVLAARWLAARAAVREASVAARDARRALRAAEAGYDAISERLRSRVGSGESLLAGGWRISVGKNGAIRVR